MASSFDKKLAKAKTKMKKVVKWGVAFENAVNIESKIDLVCGENPGTFGAGRCRGSQPISNPVHKYGHT